MLKLLAFSKKVKLLWQNPSNEQSDGRAVPEIGLPQCDSGEGGAVRASMVGRLNIDETV